MSLSKTVRDWLACVLLVVLCALGVKAILVMSAVQMAVETLPGIINERAASIQNSALSRVDTATQALNDRISESLRIVDRQLNDRAADVVLEINSLHRDLKGNVDAVSSPLAASLNGIAVLTADLHRDTVPALNSAVASSNALMGRYTLIPDQLAAAAAPSMAALEPEITCRNHDGTGYGGCAHSRVNALLGESARAGAAIARDMPALSSSFTGIAADTHKFTTKVTAPRGFWGTMRDVLSTGSGFTRALGAAGAF